MQFSENKKTCLSLIIPVFNEADAVGLFIDKVTKVFEADPFIEIELIFINDGSTDETLGSLLAIQENDSRVKIIDLSRNFGKEAALTAGLDAAKGDAVIPIDVDLQDPPELILEMAAKWKEGYEVVVGRRTNRDSDSWAKRVSANWFYNVHNIMAHPKLPKNVGDFRLMDRCVVETFQQLPESRRFMKGLFAWVGFRTAYVDYTRPERSAGQSKFNGWKLWNFALEGITSFSTSLLRIWTYIGLGVSLVSFAFAMFVVIKVLLYGVDVPGYASIIILVSFLGGLQLVGIGVIGEYLGRTYIESKRRPIYLVRRTYERSGKNGS
ncbi:glycosyltransferase (plasmid) [Deltaproteobacteria bacterium Smac51]|nr:glycosyltransferase [Deltaproteobacteria bacterium Smac51]